MKKTLAIVLSVVMLVALCACSGVSLNGTEWKLVNLKVDALEVNEEFLPELGMDGSIVFEDKQAVVSSLGITETVDYTIKGNVVTMTNPDGVVLTAVIEEDTMVIDMGKDGIMTFRKI